MKELDFYSRQIHLKDIGLNGQKLLKESRVLVVGAGGLGHPVGAYLTAAGVGKITFLDFDKVEVSNLNRQVYFSVEDIDKSKCDVLRDKLVEKNPFIQIDSVFEKLTTDNAKKIISDYDIIVDCCDNFSTKFLLHDCCWFLNKALVQGSVYQYEGQLQVFDFRSNRQEKSCLRCLWPTTPNDKCISNCEQSGIIGSVVGTLGSMQAMEVIKLITSVGEECQHGLTCTLNLLNLDMQKVRWSKKDECPLCSPSPSITSLDFINYHILDECEILNAEGHSGKVIDIREIQECKEKKSSYTVKPLSDIKNWKGELLLGETYIFACSSGKRSLSLAKELNNLGYNCYSLYGGLVF